MSDGGDTAKVVVSLRRFAPRSFRGSSGIEGSGVVCLLDLADTSSDLEDCNSARKDSTSALRVWT